MEPASKRARIDGASPPVSPAAEVVVSVAAAVDEEVDADSTDVLRLIQQALAERGFSYVQLSS